MSILVQNKAKLSLMLLLIVTLFSFAQLAQKVTDFAAFDKKMKDISASPFSKQKVKYIYFFLNKEKVNNVRYFSNMLEEFLLTLNIRGTLYTVEDLLLIAFVNMDAKVDTEFLMSHFEGAFTDVKVRYPS